MIGHVNGSRYIVLAISKGVIHALLISGPKAGAEIFIPRILFQPKQPQLMYEFERRQFPVRACFGITANKSQGQTFSQIGIYLPDEFFSHGKDCLEKNGTGPKIRH